MGQATNDSGSVTSSAARSAAVRPWAITAGLVAPVLLVGAFFVFEFFQGPNYSRMEHTISDMYAVTAPNGWLLASIIAVCGALTIVFIWWGLYPALGRTRMALVCAVLFTLSVYGIGDLFAPIERLGCRMADAGCTPDLQVANTGGTLDSLLTTLGIFIFVSAVITTGFTMRDRAGLRSYAVAFIVAGFVFAGWLALSAVFADVGGLWERIAADGGAAILFALAWVVRGRQHATTA